MEALGIKQLQVSSPSFDHECEIPAKFTCDGLNISPALELKGIPDDTISLAIIMEDPDAREKIFDHWLVWNIPPAHTITENSTPGLEGKNSSGKIGYMGPCPPSGTHRYFFKIYAVDRLLDLERGANKSALQQVLDHHILANGELIGRYSRKK